MSPEEKAGRAKDLLNDTLFVEIMSDLEQSAIDIAISAAPGDHERRADYALQARAIRSLRSKLTEYANPETYARKSIA